MERTPPPVAPPQLQRFAIRRPVGRGGMGVVYEAEDLEQGGVVALKTLLHMSADGLMRFKAEFRALQDLHHANLIRLGELVEENGLWFFTMELLEGVDFRKYVRGRSMQTLGSSSDEAAERASAELASADTADGVGQPLVPLASTDMTLQDPPLLTTPPTALDVEPISDTDETMDGYTGPVQAGTGVEHDSDPAGASQAGVSQAGESQMDSAVHGAHRSSHVQVRTASDTFDQAKLRDALTQLVRGLAALHAIGKVHRDIKPSNVMITGEGRVVLMDLGLVADVAQRTASQHGIVGTVAYMAPEQALGQPPGPPADCYSVGVMLYEALTGVLPFVHKDPAAVLHRKITRKAPSPDWVVASLPRDLVTLCNDLLAREPERRPDAPAILERLAGAKVSDQPKPQRSGVFFVGRRAELETLHHTWQATTDGKPRVLLVHGASGVGKSALLRHFLADVEHRDPAALILHGRCYERESVPYKAIDGVIDELAQWWTAHPHVLTLPRSHGALLAQLFPVLRRVPTVAGDEAGPVKDSVELRSRAFAALRALLHVLAKHRRLLLSIDDLQWADADSMALLAHLFDAPDPPPLLLIATVREGVTAGDPVRLDAIAERIACPVVRLLVGQLDTADASQLANRLLRDQRGATPLAAELDVQALLREADGHPMFLTELVRHASRFGTAPDGRGLDDALRARVDQLPDDAREVIHLVATAGQPLAQGLLAQALGIDMGELTGRLALLRSETLVRTSGPRAADMVESYHDRVRESVYDRLPVDTARGLHRRLAEVHDRSGRDDPERCARHWHGAGDVPRAADAYVRAARKAESVLAFARAAEFYRAALALYDDHDPSGAALLRPLADVLSNAGHGPEAAAVYLRAAQATITTQDTATALVAENAVAGITLARTLRVRAAEELLRSGHLDEGMLTMQGVMRELLLPVPKSPTRAVISLLWTRARVWWRGLKWSERQEQDIAPDDLLRIDACWSIAVSLGHVTPVLGGDIQARHLLMALELGEPHRIARSLAAEALFVCTDGASAAARTKTLVDSATQLAQRLDHPRALAMAAWARGFAAYFLGQWQVALEELLQAERILREQCIAVTRELATVQLFALWSMSYLGNLRDTASHMHAWVRAAEVRADRYSATSMRLGAMNLVWLAADDPTRARAEIEAAMGPWSTEGGMQFMDAVMALTNIELFVGDPDAARRRIQDAWKPLVKAFLLTVQVSRVEMHGQRGRIHVACAVGRDANDPVARAYLRQAAADAKRMISERLPWAVALGNLLDAGIHACRQDQHRVVTALRAAIDGFDATHMALHAAVARMLLARRVAPGPEADALREAADATFRQNDVRNPAQIAAVLAPGLS